MWERFSYYGMRALLVLYLIDHFGFADQQAYAIYGSYTALVYITPLIGGYVADRWLGHRKAVLCGALLLAVGHFLLAFEDNTGRYGLGLTAFYLALSFIVVGAGFLKANVSTLVGLLYDRADLRRDSGFTIFYMGINLGAALGPIVAGWLGETYGWRYGFGAAGVGMLFGVVVLVRGTPAFMGHGEAPHPARLKIRTLGISQEWLIYVGGLAAVLVAWKLLQNDSLVRYLLYTAGIALVAHLLWTACAKLESVDRERLLAALALMILSVLFWALYEQAGSSLNMFTERRVDRALFGVNVPASVFQSLNSIYIILLAPLFAIMWTSLARRGREPSVPIKFGLAMIQLGAGFLVLVAGALGAGRAPTPVLYIFLIYLLHTTSELCLSPVGLSAMTRLSIPSMVGLVMGAWMFAVATGSFLAGLIASATGSGQAGPKRVIEVYSVVGWVAISVGLLILVAAAPLKRLMHVENSSEPRRLRAGSGATS
jgi:POT family proton-dependent oligopeptide transporter